MKNVEISQERVCQSNEKCGNISGKGLLTKHPNILDALIPDFLMGCISSLWDYLAEVCSLHSRTSGAEGVSQHHSQGCWPCWKLQSCVLWSVLQERRVPELSWLGEPWSSSTSCSPTQLGSRKRAFPTPALLGMGGSGLSLLCPPGF